ncbi:hypothetical protein FB451DRAFT_1449145 [Mycena latifolia]|nr:hypothetical protein FB451DRAFT_1449145 [Mycena latifolia]
MSADKLYPFLHKEDIDGTNEEHPDILNPEIMQCMNRVMGEYHGIDDLGTGVRTIKIQDVSREVWDVLERRGYEEANYRLEYYSDSRTVVASRQTSIHGAYKHLFRPFQDIAWADELGDYNVAYNTTIQRYSPWAYLTPDFSFSHWPRNKNFLILECGWAQSSAEVAAKTEAWLTVPDTVLAIHLDIQGAKSTRRATGPEPGYTMKGWADFHKARAPLSPVVFEGHTWSAGIDKIVMTIYHREYPTETFDITPAPAGDAQRADARAAAQARVDSYLGAELAEFMTPARFAEVFSEARPFSLEWGQFYERLDVAVQKEAFDRYRTWAWSHGLTKRNGLLPHAIAAAVVPRKPNAACFKAENEGYCLSEVRMGRKQGKTDRWFLHVILTAAGLDIPGTLGKDGGNEIAQVRRRGTPREPASPRTLSRHAEEEESLYGYSMSRAARAIALAGEVGKPWIVKQWLEQKQGQRTACSSPSTNLPGSRVTPTKPPNARWM